MKVDYGNTIAKPITQPKENQIFASTTPEGAIEAGNKKTANQVALNSGTNPNSQSGGKKYRKHKNKTRRARKGRKSRKVHKLKGGDAASVWAQKLFSGKLFKMPNGDTVVPPLGNKIKAGGVNSLESTHKDIIANRQQMKAYSALDQVGGKKSTRRRKSHKTRKTRKGHKAHKSRRGRKSR